MPSIEKIKSVDFDVFSWSLFDADDDPDFLKVWVSIGFDLGLYTGRHEDLNLSKFRCFSFTARGEFIDFLAFLSLTLSQMFLLESLG